MKNLLVYNNRWTLCSTYLFFAKTHIRMFLPWRNTWLYSSQAQFRDSN